ncbi:MAG: EamA family transporter [Anaerolineae bacterium]
MLFPTVDQAFVVQLRARYLSAAFVSLCVLFEPIGSTILAVFFLNEQPKPLQIVGGILILVALVVASKAPQIDV